MLLGTESEEEEGKSLALIKNTLFIYVIIFVDFLFFINLEIFCHNFHGLKPIPHIGNIYLV